MELLVQEFGWNPKSTEHFDGKESKIGVPSKDGSHHDEQYRIKGRHDDNGRNTIGPRPIFETSFQAQDIFDRGSDLYINQRKEEEIMREKSETSNCNFFPISAYGTKGNVSTYQHHGGCSRNGKYGTNEYHFSIPGQSPPRRDFFGPQKSLQKCGVLGSSVGGSSGSGSGSCCGSGGFGTSLVGHPSDLNIS